MNLHRYLSLPESMSAAELARRLKIKNPAQVRQWQHGYADRLPSPENCVAIEQATECVVRRWDLRPSDWWLIWPELIDADGAPAIPEPEAKAA